MDPLSTWPAPLIERLAGVDACDGYVVLVVDPQTGEADAHRPYDGLAALTTADQLRREFDTEDLAEVAVTVIRLHHPAPNVCHT